MMRYFPCVLTLDNCHHLKENTSSQGQVKSTCEEVSSLSSSSITQPTSEGRKNPLHQQHFIPSGSRESCLLPQTQYKLYNAHEGLDGFGRFNTGQLCRLDHYRATHDSQYYHTFLPNLRPQPLKHCKCSYPTSPPIIYSPHWLPGMIPA